MSVFGVPEGSAKPALPPEVLMEKYPPSALKTAPLKDDRSLSEGQISKEFKTSVQAPDYPLNSSQEKMIIQSIYDNNYPDSAERLLHFIENSPYRSSKELAQQYYASLENKTSSFMQSQNEKIKSKAINMAAEEDKVKELLGSENLPSNYKEILGMTEEAKVKAALGIPDNVSLPENYKEILQMTDKDKVKMALKIPPNVKLRDDYKQILGIPVEPTEDDTSLSEGQSEVGFVTRDTSPSSVEFGSSDVLQKRSIIQNFLKDKLKLSDASNKFNVQALPVSMMQEPRNADNIFTREGDFPNIIDPNNNVVLNQLFLRLLEKETINLDENAVSSKGAVGLSQLMPDTIKDPGSGLIALLPESERQFIDPKIVGDTPLTDNNANLLFGTFYLKALLLYYKGDVAKALSAYNHGLGNTDKLIKKHKGAWTNNLPVETDDYIRTIKGNLPTEIPLPKTKPKKRVGGFV